MRIEESAGDRAEVACELLSRGDFVNFQGLGLQVMPSGVLACRVFTQWMPENVGQRIALEEIKAGQEKLAALVVQSPGFASIIQSRSQTWELLFDYGQGAIRLARFEHDSIAWETGFPKTP